MSLRKTGLRRKFAIRSNRPRILEGPSVRFNRFCVWVLCSELKIIVAEDSLNRAIQRITTSNAALLVFLVSVCLGLGVLAGVSVL